MLKREHDNSATLGRERLRKQLLYVDYCLFCIKRDAGLIPPPLGPDEPEQQSTLADEVNRLRFTLEHIMFTGMDCPSGDDPAAFYKAGLGYAVRTAARALTGEDIRTAAEAAGGEHG